MLASTVRSSPAQPASPLSKLVVGITICASAALFIYLVDRWGARGVSHYLRDVHLVLEAWGGKWVVAALMALLGAAFCWTAWCQLFSKPPKQRFAEGVIVLKSLEWMKHPPKAIAESQPDRD